MSFGNKWSRPQHGESVSESVRNKIREGIKSSRAAKAANRGGSKKIADANFQVRFDIY